MTTRNSTVLNGFDPAGEGNDNKAYLNGSVEIGGVLMPTDLGLRLNTQSVLKWIDVVAPASILDGAGHVPVMAGMDEYQYKVREIRLIGGGTNFGAGGNRNLSLTDGTTIYTTVPDATIKAAPSATITWGNAALPFLTNTSDVLTVEGANLYLAYSGGTTDHGGVGSIKFSVLVEIFNQS